MKVVILASGLGIRISEESQFKPKPMVDLFCCFWENDASRRDCRPFHSYLIGSGQARPLREFLLGMKEIVTSDLAFSFGSASFMGIGFSKEVFDMSAMRRIRVLKPGSNLPRAEDCRRTLAWL